MRITLVLVGAVVAGLEGCGGGGDSSSGGSTGSAVPSAGQAGWLDPHNSVRAGALGGVTVSPMPSPPLPALSWSTSAEAIAKAWAEGCVYQHNGGRSADGIQRGENIAATAPGGRADVTPAYVVGLWAGEWPDYDYATNSCAPGKVCGHYTQLVWRDTARVGCARARCTTGSPFGTSFSTWDFFVCDYEPPGNYTGQRPY